MMTGCQAAAHLDYLGAICTAVMSSSVPPVGGWETLPRKGVIRVIFHLTESPGDRERGPESNKWPAESRACRQMCTSTLNSPHSIVLYRSESFSCLLTLSLAAHFFQKTLHCIHVLTFFVRWLRVGERKSSLLCRHRLEECRRDVYPLFSFKLQPKFFDLISLHYN